MRTFVLVWHPERSDYRLVDFQHDFLLMEYGELPWPVQEWDGIRSGDNFYLVRSGRGIVMRGFILSSPLPVKGRPDQRRILLRPSVMIHPDHPKGLLSVRELSGSLPDIRWEDGPSGRQLPEGAARQLDALWNRYLERFDKADFDNFLLGRDLRPRAGIDEAISLALNALYDKKDEDGESAILHPLRVGLAGASEEEQVCGILQSVAGDKDWPLGDIRDKGFSESVIDVLQLLVRKDGTSLDDYVRGIAASGNRTAIAVETNALKKRIEQGKTGPRSAEYESALRILCGECKQF